VGRPQSAIQEPCFVPRSPTAAESDGYLIALIDNHVTNYSDLAVFDAQRIDEGPIARQAADAHAPWPSWQLGRRQQAGGITEGRTAEQEPDIVLPWRRDTSRRSRGWHVIAETDLARLLTRHSKHRQLCDTL
jgi:hypothetical protein